MSHNKRTFGIALPGRQRAFWILVALLCVSVIFYLLFVIATIVRVLEREETVGFIQTLSVQVSERETDYLLLGQDITLQTAEEMGYSEVAEAKYLSRGNILTLKNDR